MKADFKTVEQAAVASDAEKLINSGADNEIVLGFLRERGFNKLDSIKALIGATGMSLGDAKNIVHHSRAWQDSFARDEEFHASLLKAVQTLGLDEPSR
jgi:ribosomal protein L7/L12